MKNTAMFSGNNRVNQRRSIAGSEFDRNNQAATIQPPVQREAVPEELPAAQGKFETAQLEALPEEMPAAQGKFATAQLEALPEEMPAAQGKFATAQLEALPEEMPAAQGKFVTVQREALPEEMPAAQGKFNGPAFQLKTVQREEAPAKENNTGLPDNLKAGVEQLSGFSMDDVKVHYNSSQPAQLNALAYAQGTDIHVAPGQEQHLAHEAWHVAQQKQGRVQATMQLKLGVPVNDDPSLENEADHMGAKAAEVGAFSLKKK